jgi:hypothetical protein
MKRTILIATALFLATAGMGRARAITPHLAQQAIVGEAAGDGYTVQLGIACALRNRGSLAGVYGVNAAHNATEPDWVWRQAARAWRESALHDITHGATHFGCWADVLKGTFTGLQLVAVLGQGHHKTYFFK